MAAKSAEIPLLLTLDEPVAYCRELLRGGGALAMASSATLRATAQEPRPARAREPPPDPARERRPASAPGCDPARVPCPRPRPARCPPLLFGDLPKRRHVESSGTSSPRRRAAIACSIRRTVSMNSKTAERKAFSASESADTVTEVIMSGTRSAGSPAAEIRSRTFCAKANAGCPVGTSSIEEMRDFARFSRALRFSHWASCSSSEIDSPASTAGTRLPSLRTSESATSSMVNGC